MKKLILGATILMVSLSGAFSAQADHNNGIGGLFIGGGSGAIIGQAIGRNTEATLIGTAVGSLLGYVIGNEMDKGSHYYQPVHYRPPQPVIHRHQRVVKHRPVVQHHYYRPVEYRRIAAPAPQCREAEILGTVNGRAKKIYGTVCRTANGWELVSEPTGPAGYSSDRYDRYDRYDRRNQHWVDRRF